MANKKVSQLTSKPSVLTTDLFPIADPSTGQLYKTTISDLGTAIGSGVSSVNSLVGAVVLDTDDIQELVSPTNKWFTDTRARAALSASSPLAYNSGTGVFSIPAATSTINGYLSSTDWTTFNAKANDSLVVHLAGTETITGAKTFSANLTAGASAFFNTGILLKDGATSVAAGHFGIASLNSNTLGFSSSSGRAFDLIMPTSGGAITVPNGSGTLALTSDLSVYALDSTVVHNTGNESISGVKTFTTQLAGAQLRFSESGGFGNVSGYTQIGGTADYFNFVNGGNTKQATFNYGTGGSGYTYTLPNSNGTLALTSQLSSYLPLSGGTLTGALSGTSATFTHLLTGTSALFTSNVTIRPSAGYNAYFQTSGTSVRINYLNDALSVNVGAAFRATDYSFQDGTGSPVFTIASTGAATFSSSVTATTGLTVGSLGSGSDAVITLANNASGSPRSIYYKASTATINFTQTGGADLMTLTNGGNLGIGTTSPTNGKLEVQTSATTAGLWVQTGGTSGSYTIADFRTGTNLSAFSIKGNGDLYASNGAAFFFGSSALTYLAGGDTTMSMAVNNSERMRITSAGNVVIGDNSTDNTGKLYYASPGVGAYNGVLSLYHSTSNVSGSGYVNFYVNSSVIGSIGQVGSTAVAYYTTSDYRLKEDLKPINGLEIVNKIKVYDYKWKAEDSRMDGVLAHELAEILPYAVTGEKDGERMQGVDYSKIVPVLIQAIKDQQVQIEQLKNK